MPCGPTPTFTRCTSRPVRVEIAYTSLLYRPLSHRTPPSADRPPMSGEPPPGMCHFLNGLRVRNEITLIEPSPRLETYNTRESRLGYSPCAPRPVGCRRSLCQLWASMSHTPCDAMSAT